MGLAMSFPVDNFTGSTQQELNVPAMTFASCVICHALISNCFPAYIFPILTRGRLCFGNYVNKEVGLSFPDFMCYSVSLQSKFLFSAQSRPFISPRRPAFIPRKGAPLSPCPRGPCLFLNPSGSQVSGHGSFCQRLLSLCLGSYVEPDGVS